MVSDQSAKSTELQAQTVLLQERRGPVALLTLNRSSARNGLSEALIGDLRKALSEIEKDKTVRVVVLASSGPAFCSGHDLKELAARRNDEDGGRKFFLEIMQSCSALMQSVVDLPQPVIAAVQGVATAAGCQLVASCDLAVASNAAKFATPGVNIGLFCSTPMVALSRNVSAKQSMEMLLTGEMVTAERALQIGLIDRVTAAGQELEEALALAVRIAEKSPYALRVGKKAFYKQQEMSLSQAYNYTAQIMVENLLSHDAGEGICAFLEKRRPNWSE